MSGYDRKALVKALTDLDAATERVEKLHAARQRAISDHNDALGDRRNTDFWAAELLSQAPGQQVFFNGRHYRLDKNGTSVIATPVDHLEIQPAATEGSE